MEVTLQYFDGCPNWKTAEKHLHKLVAEGWDLTVRRQRIEDHQTAEQCGFRGSPTVLIDGVDPFADKDAPIGLSCRIYRTEEGSAGTPTLEQLRQAVADTQRN